MSGLSSIILFIACILVFRVQCHLAHHGNVEKRDYNYKYPSFTISTTNTGGIQEVTITSTQTNQASIQAITITQTSIAVTTLPTPAPTPTVTVVTTATNTMTPSVVSCSVVTAPAGAATLLKRDQVRQNYMRKRDAYATTQLYACYHDHCAY